MNNKEFIAGLDRVLEVIDQDMKDHDYNHDKWLAMSNAYDRVRGLKNDVEQEIRMGRW